MRTPQLAALAAALLLPVAALAIAQDDPAAPVAPDAPAARTVTKEVVAEGTGEACGDGRVAVVHYTGTFLDGKKFDSSRDRDEPLVVEVGVGMVIAGWDQTLAQMRKGDRWTVTIPWEMAYGERGSPPAIPPKSDLVFDIEMLGFVTLPIEYATKGEGPALASGDLAETHITISLADGAAIFDSRSTEGGEPVVQPVGRPSGLLALDMMVRRARVGDHVKAHVPAVLGFGKRGNPPRVPPDAELTIDLEILRVLAPSITWIERGSGPTPEHGQRVTVHYTGTLPDGTKFDSSRDRLKPFPFILGLGQVITGWDMTVKQMRVGDRVTVDIPYQLAYGADGRPPKIPKKTNLIFDIELLSVE